MAGSRVAVPVLSFLLQVACDAAVPVPTSSPHAATQRSHATTRITVSRDTTRVVAPLAADDLPDYAAALDAVLGKGVTDSNNAALVIGPLLAGRTRGNSPWTPLEPPDPPVSRMLEAAGRPRYFVRVNARPGTRHGGWGKPFEVFGPELENLGSALMDHAIDRAHAGDIEAAGTEIAALARLSAHAVPALTYDQQGLHARESAAETVPVLWARPLDALTGARLLTRLQEVPGYPDVADTLDRVTRLQSLGRIVAMWRDRSADRPISWATREGKTPMPLEWLAKVPVDAVDWDEALRTVNVWIDGLVVELRANPDEVVGVAYRSRVPGGGLGTEHRGLAEWIRDTPPDPQTRLALARTIAEYNFSPPWPVIREMQASEAAWRVALLALAVSIHTARHGHPPHSLAALDVPGLRPELKQGTAGGYRFTLVTQGPRFAVRSQRLPLPLTAWEWDTVGTCADEKGTWWRANMRSGRPVLYARHRRGESPLPDSPSPSTTLCALQ